MARWAFIDGMLALAHSLGLDQSYPILNPFLSPVILATTESGRGSMESPMNIPTGIVGMILGSLLLIRAGKNDAGAGLDDRWGYGLGVCASG